MAAATSFVECKFQTVVFNFYYIICDKIEKKSCKRSKIRGVLLLYANQNSTTLILVSIEWTSRVFLVYHLLLFFRFGPISLVCLCLPLSLFDATVVNPCMNEHFADTLQLIDWLTEKSREPESRKSRLLRMMHIVAIVFDLSKSRVTISIKQKLLCTSEHTHTNAKEGKRRRDRIDIGKQASQR